MPDTATTVAALERNWDMVHNALADLDDATLSVRPNAQSNSISWLLWHMTRVGDRFIHTRLQDSPQMWIKDGWHEKFNMAPEPDDIGLGWTAVQVDAWQPPSREILLGYFSAVNDATQNYLRPLSASDLDRHIAFPPPLNTLSVGEALGVLVWDNIAHGGQIAYLRGYFRGMGWFR